MLDKLNRLCSSQSGGHYARCRGRIRRRVLRGSVPRAVLHTVFPVSDRKRGQQEGVTLLLPFQSSVHNLQFLLLLMQLLAVLGRRFRRVEDAQELVVLPVILDRFLLAQDVRRFAILTVRYARYQYLSVICSEAGRPD
jgi:hypothetical protein